MTSKVNTLNCEELMRSNTFASIYSANDIFQDTNDWLPPAKGFNWRPRIQRNSTKSLAMRSIENWHEKMFIFNPWKTETQTFNTWAINGKVLGTRQYSFLSLEVGWTLPQHLKHKNKDMTWSSNKRNAIFPVITDTLTVAGCISAVSSLLEVSGVGKERML